MRPFRFDRRWRFAVPADRFWETIARTDDYPSWWSWLRAFEVDELREGAVAEATIQAPLPYALRFAVTVDELVEGALVATTITGDLHGPARLEIAADGDAGSCTARLVWSLELRDPVLRTAARIARPAMVWAHDRVVDIGVTQFRRHALPP